MAIFEMVMPQMGESVMEGTIIKWLKNVGDYVKQDESVLEVATDKVDTEIPSTISGYIHELLVKEGDVVQIGKPIAYINSEKNTEEKVEFKAENKIEVSKPIVSEIAKHEVVEISTVVDVEPKVSEIPYLPTHTQTVTSAPVYGRFYSPLVLNIAKEEKIPFVELETIPGTGQDGRVTKNDILNYLTNRKSVNNTDFVKTVVNEVKVENNVVESVKTQDTTKASLLTDKEVVMPTEQLKPSVSVNGASEIVQMDRMRKMISERMLESQRISAHVTSFVEADVTNLIHWKNKMKHEFKNRENDTLTLTPLFIEAIGRAIKDFPMINASVDGDKIIVKKSVNIGMAVALSNGNLIVPVIKNVDQLNIVGITKKVNELAKKARENKLTADDLSDGTYTMSNVGQFGNVMGTPIIVQPQLAIMAFGTAVKKPAVIETPNGDAIGIRSLMFLSHSYDHRVVDGALGGMFVRKVADYLENFDVNRKIW